jgi:excisionase family DNA binding protein
MNVPRGAAFEAGETNKDVNGSSRTDENVEIAFYSTRELANWLGVSARLIQMQAASGKLRAIRVGREWRIPHSEVLRRFGWAPAAGVGL